MTRSPATASRLKRTSRNSRTAFTLMELMVVILIIGVMLSVLVGGLMYAFRTTDKKKTATMISTLSAGIDRFQTNFHFYPHSALEDQSRDMGAQTYIFDPAPGNTGIETLVMALRTRNNGGPFMEAEFLIEHQSNTDNDEITDNFANVDGALKLFEIADPWGTPLVYVNLADLNNPARATFMVVKADGTQVEIVLEELKKALADESTGLMKAKTYVIWSFGEDMINDYGNGDDIASWKN